MADKLYVLPGATLPTIAKNARHIELRRRLKDLSTDQGKNYGLYELSVAAPDTSIAILPSPAVAPNGSTTICNGHLTIGGKRIAVTAFRLSADQ